jgi:hypothetical protein
MKPPYLTQVELAARWRISPRTLERWRWAGEGLPFTKIGGRVLYSLSDIQAYEAAQTRRITGGFTSRRQHLFTPKRGRRRDPGIFALSTATRRGRGIER